MAINEARGKPASLQVALLITLIATIWGAYPDDYAISDGNIGWITFTATDIYKPGIAQQQVGGHESARNLNAALKSVHKKYPP
jgi:hypothetical protein